MEIIDNMDYSIYPADNIYFGYIGLHQFLMLLDFLDTPYQLNFIDLTTNNDQKETA